MALVLLVFLAPPAIGSAFGLVRDRPQLNIHVLLSGKRPAVYGRTTSGTNFMIIGSEHSEPLLDRALPFFDGDIDLVILPDSQKTVTAIVTAVAAGRKIDRLWVPALDLDSSAYTAGRDRYVINVDSTTTVEILPPVGLSPESAIRLVSGDLSLLIPPSTTPLTPPPSWRANLVLLGDRPPSAFTTPAFLDSTRAAALVAGLGPGGTAVSSPATSCPTPSPPVLPPINPAAGLRYDCGRPARNIR